jgi:hypothetical protein
MSFPILNYVGNWDAYKNSPTLEDEIGTLGDAYAIYISNPSEPFIFNRDLGSGEKSWLGQAYAYFDGLQWQCTASGAGGSGGLTPAQIMMYVSLNVL